ncbi:MAG: hypothetical protein DYG96_12850, partial [Chlorobi bacterium CHB2]|nr:hypothetical protein [Chlorobi bacterium CHB2]
TLNAGSGVISASNDKIENVADPTAAQDAATKNYIDNTALGGVLGPFVQLGPAALQTYTGANPLIRLNETGGSAPNLMDLRTAGTQHLLLTNGGALTVTNIEGTPIGATTRSTANVTDLDANGNVTLGNAAADVVTVNGTTTFANPVTANGAVTLGNGNDNITLNAGTGIISASGDKIENVADPTAAQDAATKNYVDNGFVRLGPASAQTYTGANPLIRLDETGGSAPNLMDLRTAGTQHLVLTNAGALTATSIQATPIGTTTRSLANVTDLDANGDVILGNAAADAVTVNGTTTFANPVTANGAVTLGNGNDNITLNAGTGVISASNDKIEDVADPTAAQDAATKNYIDNTVLGGVVGPFVQLGPAALQTYTGANPLIRLNETGGGTPNLMDLRTSGTQHLLLTNGGSLTVTAIEGSPIGGTTRSTGAFTTLDANGAVTLGNGNDNITLDAGSGIISASGDKIENVADPTVAQDAATKNYIDNTALGGVVGPFVQLGPTSAQTYTGAQPLIRLDETGGSAPNLMDLRTAGTQHLVLTNAGALTATSIQATPIGTTTRSLANVTDLDANGNVTLGNAAADAVAVNGTTTFAAAVTANDDVTLGNGNDNITLNAGSGVISASNDKIENVADPTAAQDAATKNYDLGSVGVGGQ